tara:strand:+ start:60 stop:533 length:474 start_codon:yes stop_codon:yes gene_type:complete
MTSKIKQICLGGSFIATLIATPFIVKWEGVENHAYQDIVGVWTVCSGETKNVHKGQRMTDSECVALTQERVLEFAEGVDDVVTVPMTAKYHASLTSWAYNVGLGAASKSTLVRVLNQGDYKGACEQLKRWNRAGGRAVQGLTNRRQDEYTMCIDGIE